MPVTFQLLDEGSIIRIKTSTPYTSNDFTPIFKQEMAHRDAFLVEHPGKKIHMLIDMTDAKSTPSNFLRARNTPGLKHPTAGYIVLVGATGVIRGLSEMIFRITRFQKMHFADTEPEGLSYLRTHMH